MFDIYIGQPIAYTETDGAMLTYKISSSILLIFPFILKEDFQRPRLPR